MRSESTPGRKPLNVRRALELVDAGMTYRAAGAYLAREEGRPVAYTEVALAKAVRLYLARHYEASSKPLDRSDDAS